MYPMTGEMEDVIESSRIYAIACKHDFIDFVHLFGGLLTCNCSAKYKLGSFAESKWRKIVEQLYGQSVHVSQEETIPLTKKAEKMIIKSFGYVMQTNDEYISSDHLLLALLSSNNLVAEQVQKAGIVFEDVNREAFKGIEIVKRTDLTVLPKRSSYSSFDKWLIPKNAIKDKLDEWHYIANEFYEIEDYDQCIKACDIAQSLSTENPIFEILKAYAYYGKREFDLAIPCFLELLKNNPNEFDYQFSLASLYDEVGNYAEAAKIYNNLLIKYPNNATLLNNIGFSLQRQNYYSDAIPYYNSAIENDPEYAYPYDNLGYCKYKLGDYDSAVNLIDKALELDKGNSYAYKYKGIIAKESNNKNDALKFFKQALKYGYTRKYGNEVNEYLQEMGF